MNFKRYNESDNSWTDSHYIKETATDTITTLPAIIYPLAQTATIGLKGNTVQNGTPTPDNPVMPQGIGDKTANLFNYKIAYASYLQSDGTVQAYAQQLATVQNSLADFIGQTITIRIYCDTVKATRLYINATENGVQKSSNAIYRSESGYMLLTVTPQLSTDKWSITYGSEGTTGNEKLSQFMVNTGSAPLPYEPYGVKIPISSAGQTTPVYLGEVQTTRKIKKLVLTGEETWWTSGAYTGALYAYHSQFPGIKPLTPIFCTHLVDAYESSYIQGTCQNDSNSIGMWVFDTVTSPTAFKTYLAQQYAAGTPVTVWYVLATEETAVVNEPLMKIGEYADTVSNVSIPVTAGGDTLSVGTTVQPSEVTVNYKGWHPVADVHERDNGAWT